jgi:DNA-binding NtrC family response regulator
VKVASEKTCSTALPSPSCLPPLRERRGDLQPLIDGLLEKANRIGAEEEPGYKSKTLSPGARRLLLAHPWPGNVRELENTLMRATVWMREGVISEQAMRAALDESGPPAALTLQQGFNLDEQPCSSQPALPATGARADERKQESGCGPAGAQQQADIQ